MRGNEADEIAEELFDSLLQKYHRGLDESIKRKANFFLIVLIYCITNFIK